MEATTTGRRPGCEAPISGIAAAEGEAPIFAPGDRVRIAAFADLLFAKGILTPEELARKMEAVSARFPADAGSETAAPPEPAP